MSVGAQNPVGDKDGDVRRTGVAGFGDDRRVPGQRLAHAGVAVHADEPRVSGPSGGDEHESGGTAGRRGTAARAAGRLRGGAARAEGAGPGEPRRDAPVDGRLTRSVVPASGAHTRGPGTCGKAPEEPAVAALGRPLEPGLPRLTGRLPAGESAKSRVSRQADGPDGGPRPGALFGQDGRAVRAVPGQGFGQPAILKLLRFSRSGRCCRGPAARRIRRRRGCRCGRPRS